LERRANQFKMKKERKIISSTTASTRFPLYGHWQLRSPEISRPSQSTKFRFPSMMKCFQKQNHVHANARPERARIELHWLQCKFCFLSFPSFEPNLEKTIESLIARAICLARDPRIKASPFPWSWHYIIAPQKMAEIVFNLNLSQAQDECVNKTFFT